MSRSTSPARHWETCAPPSPGSFPAHLPPVAAPSAAPSTNRPAPDRELDAVIALTATELDGAFPVTREGDDLVFDPGPSRYRRDMRAALRAYDGDPERTAREVVALVGRLAEIVAPE